LPFPLLGIEITTNKDVIKELKKYVKGFFFVRQKRMPLIMCQGLVVGMDTESRTPTLPTLGGIVRQIDVNKSYVETDLNDINYVSEGFLGRYYYKLVPKPTSFWARLWKALTAVVVLVVAAIATVFTFGAAGASIFGGVALATALLGGAMAVGAAIGTIVSVAVSVLTVTVTVLAVDSAVLAVRQKRNAGKAQKVKGRHEEIPSGYERKELDESRQIVHDLDLRYIIKDSSKNNPEAIIVPDYQVNQPYYN
jgi:hypothetical protein